MELLCLILIVSVITHSNYASSNSIEAKKINLTALNHFAGQTLNKSFRAKAHFCEVLQNGTLDLIYLLHLRSAGNGSFVTNFTALVFGSFTGEAYKPRSVQNLLKAFRDNLTKLVNPGSRVLYGCYGKRNSSHEGGTIACTMFKTEKDKCVHPGLPNYALAVSNHSFNDHWNKPTKITVSTYQ